MTKLVEKSHQFVSDMAICGVNVIVNSSLLFTCIQELFDRGIRTRDEYQLTDAFQLMVDKGAEWSSFPLDAWFDCGTHESLLSTNRHLLEDKTGPEIKAEAVIRLPVYVDPSAEISGSVIGPYVSVGQEAQIHNSVVRNTIIGARATVDGIVLDESIVGYQATVNGRASHLNVGDHSQITS